MKTYNEMSYFEAVETSKALVGAFDIWPCRCMVIDFDIQAPWKLTLYFITEEGPLFIRRKNYANHTRSEAHQDMMKTFRGMVGAFSILKM